MKANYKHLVLLAIFINLVFMSFAHANDDEVDAEFMEFLADMEEVTGSGFDRWLEDDSEDKNIMNTKEMGQNTQSDDNENK